MAPLIDAGTPAAPEDVQAWLVDFYGLPGQAPVDRFLCGREAATALLGEAPTRAEMLLVENAGARGEEIEVSLYLDPDLRDRVSAAIANGRPPGLDDLWLVVEGVSHFAYLAYRSERGEPVTQLELELQAEVDKYALTLLAGPDGLAGWGVGAVRASQRLRRRLFEDVRFLDAKGSAAGDRYRAAHRLAAWFCGDLEARELREPGVGGVRQRLRAFYRGRQAEKLAAVRR